MNISGLEISSASSVSTSAPHENLQPGFQQSRAVFWTILTRLNHHYFRALIINAYQQCLGIFLFSVCSRIESSLMKLKKEFKLFSSAFSFSYCFICP